MSGGGAEVVERDGRVWVPGNRWDLVRARVDGVAPTRTAIVVPYFEQPDSLRRMYAGLADLPAAAFELVVADDGSAVAPPRPPAGFALRTTMVRQDDAGVRPGAARNLGVAAVDADVIVLLDADTVPARGTVARLAAWPTLLPDALVVGTRRHADLTGWGPDETAGWLDGRRPGPAPRADPQWLAEGYRRTDDLLAADDRSFRFVISAVMACGRGLWDDIGGFDASRTEYGGDDWEFAYRAFNNGAVLVHDPSAVAWHDEPDWSERDGGSKDAETMWLAEVIPEPLTRGPAIRQADADTLVELDVDGASPGLVVAAISDLLHALPDTTVHLRGPVDAATRRHVAHDARVTVAEPSARQRQRARRIVRLPAPVRWAPDGLRRTVDMTTTGVGHVVVDPPVGGPPVAVVSSSRALGRARRAPEACRDAVTRSFGTWHATTAEVGITVVEGGIDLAASFGGW